MDKYDALETGILGHLALEKKKEDYNRLLAVARAAREHHYCEILERGKGPCYICEALAAVEDLL